MQEGTKQKNLPINVILLLIVLLSSFAVLELSLRAAGIGEDYEEFTYIRHSLYNPFLIFGPNINKTFKQNNGEIAYFNSQGFRQKDLLPLEKNLDEYRIFALGGSTTEDLNNGVNLHYCGEANKHLENYSFNGKYVNCVNAGKAAYSTAHTLVRLQFDLLQFKPDMITVNHNINDLAVNLFPYDDRNNYANRYLHKKYAVPYSIKYNFKRFKSLLFINQRLNIIKDNLFSEKIQTEKGIVITDMQLNPNPTELKSKENFRDNLRTIANIGKSQNIIVVFLSQPAIFTDRTMALSFGSKSYNNIVLYPEKDEMKLLFEEYNDVIKQVAEEEDIYFIDMYNLLGHDDKYFIDIVHFTGEGTIKFGEIYAKHLKDIIELEEVKNGE